MIAKKEYYKGNFVLLPGDLNISEWLQLSLMKKKSGLNFKYYK